MTRDVGWNSIDLLPFDSDTVFIVAVAALKQFGCDSDRTDGRRRNEFDSSLLELRVSLREAPRKCPSMPGRLRVDDGTSGASCMFLLGLEWVGCWGGAAATWG